MARRGESSTRAISRSLASEALPARPVARFRRIQGEGGVREFGVNPLQGPVGLDVALRPSSLGVLASHQRLRPVHHRVIEAVLPDVVALEEDQIEEGRQSFRHVALVEPEFARDHFVVAVEGVPLAGLAEQDVVAAPVRPPPFAEGVPAQVLVRVFDPAVVLVLELVLGGRRVGIAFLPEDLDEPGPLLEGLEAEKHVLLAVGDDVDHLFFEPLAVVVPQTFDLLSPAEFLLRGPGHHWQAHQQ